MLPYHFNETIFFNLWTKNKQVLPFWSSYSYVYELNIPYFRVFFVFSSAEDSSTISLALTSIGDSGVGKNSKIDQNKQTKYRLYIHVSHALFTYLWQISWSALISCVNLTVAWHCRQCLSCVLSVLSTWWNVPRASCTGFP